MPILHRAAPAEAPIAHGLLRTTKRPGRLAAVLLSLATLALAGPARALPDFDESFQEMTLGELNGQNGWTCTPGTVQILKGLGSDTTLVTHGLQGQAIAEAERLLPTPFHYTSADNAIVWGCWAYAGSGGGNKDALGGPSGHASGSNGHVFGIEVFDGHLPSTFLSCSGTEEGDALQFGHWYEFRVVANFSVPGGKATLSYRDVTLGQATFTTDATLQNVSLGDFTDGSGSYPFLSVYTRQDDQGAGGCMVDNLHVGAPGSSLVGIASGAETTPWALAASPNPARGASAAGVRCSLPVRAHVRLAAYDAQGRRLATLVDDALDAGTHVRSWDLRDASGEALPAGLYFVRLEAVGRVLQSKVTLVR